MKELLEIYSIEQILIFIVILAAAFKGAASWIDWAKGRYENKVAQSKKKDQTQEKLDELLTAHKHMCEKFTRLSDQVQLLMDSDKDDIKAYITREHHYFCYELGYIDDYNLDCLEKRYSHYQAEGGNSFVADLMGEIRALPKKTITVVPYEVSAAVIAKNKVQENNEKNN